jgi:hypothetical protein
MGSSSQRGATTMPDDGSCNLAAYARGRRVGLSGGDDSDDACRGAERHDIWSFAVSRHADTDCNFAKGAARALLR